MATVVPSQFLPAPTKAPGIDPNLIKIMEVSKVAKDEAEKRKAISQGVVDYLGVRGQDDGVSDSVKAAAIASRIPFTKPSEIESFLKVLEGVGAEKREQEKQRVAVQAFEDSGHGEVNIPEGVTLEGADLRTLFNVEAAQTATETKTAKGKAEGKTLMETFSPEELKEMGLTGAENFDIGVVKALHGESKQRRALKAAAKRTADMIKASGDRAQAMIEAQGDRQDKRLKALEGKTDKTFDQRVDALQNRNPGFSRETAVLVAHNRPKLLSGLARQFGEQLKDGTWAVQEPNKLGHRIAIEMVEGIYAKGGSVGQAISKAAVAARKSIASGRIVSMNDWRYGTEEDIIESLMLNHAVSRDVAVGLVNDWKRRGVFNRMVGAANPWED